MDYPKSVPSVGLVGGKFVDENQATGVVGSLIPSQWGNAVTDEMLAVIKAAGLSPDEANNDQLLLALQALIKKSSGRLLRTTVFARVGGVQMVSVNGGAFTATGATLWTPAPGAMSYLAEAVGSGGGSGGTSATSASQWSLTGGGSGGVYGRRFDTIPGAPQSVSIGVGGTAGAIATNGGAGSATSLGALLAVGGGSGSASNAATTGNSVYGGSTTTFTVSGANILASNGGYGTYGISLALFISGTGGSSYFGPGGPPVLSTNPGQAGVSPGSGAGGACSIPNSAGQTGGKGADGLLIIYEYA